jgi:hypothetical protein
MDRFRSKNSIHGGFMRSVLALCAAALVATISVAGCAKKEPKVPSVPPPPPNVSGLPDVANIEPEAAIVALMSAPCDVSLWKHVYHGRMATARDRLVVQKPCTTVMGKVMSAVKEDDGDWRIRLKVDPQFSSLLNAKNKSGQHGYLVVEPMCANPVLRRRTRLARRCVRISSRRSTTTKR